VVKSVVELEANAASSSNRNCLAGGAWARVAPNIVAGN